MAVRAKKDSVFVWLGESLFSIIPVFRVDRVTLGLTESSPSLRPPPLFVFITVIQRSLACQRSDALIAVLLSTGFVKQDQIRKEDTGGVQGEHVTTRS